jgi:hypothetical protein
MPPPGHYARQGAKPPDDRPAMRPSLLRLVSLLEDSGTFFEGSLFDALFFAYKILPYF